MMPTPLLKPRSNFKPMHTFAFPLVLAFAFAGLARPAAAEEQLSKVDAYFACLIGRAMVAVHKGESVEQAEQRAWKACETLSCGISSDELEGISDVLYLYLDRVMAAR
jgi:hypothetical protein